MAKKIDWMYHRKNCSGCKKATAFLEGASCTVGSIDDTAKVKYDRAAALKLAKSAKTVVTGRGKKVVSFDMKKDQPDDDTLAAAILGPSGNLKAPSIRIGDVLVVGFSEEAYKQIVGG